MSLFIASKIPVIVWKQSALSDFVKKNNIGIVVDDLIEMQEIISNMSEEQYVLLKENIERLSEKVREGFYTSNAIDKSIKLLREDKN